MTELTFDQLEQMAAEQGVPVIVVLDGIVAEIESK